MATPQSLLQSNIQNAVGTQSLAQNNVPVLANNGNPFTIYNQTPAQGGYLPPVSNAFDQWRINPAPPDPVFTGGGSGFQFPTFTLPPLGGGGGWVSPVLPPILPPAPPMSDPLPPVQVPDGGGSGQGGAGGNSGVQPLGQSGNGLLGGGGIMPPIGGTQFTTSGTPVFGSGTGGGSLFGGLTNNLSYALGGGNQYLRDNSTGVRDWRQLVDAGLNAVGIGGDFYDPTTGQWDVGRIATSLGQVFTGIPFNALLNSLANASLRTGGDSKWIPNFVENLAKRYAASGADFKANMSENRFDTNMMLNELANGPSLVSPSTGWNPFSLGSNFGLSTGFAIGQINPITGLINGSGASPFAADPNNMPSGFGPNFNPVMGGSYGPAPLSGGALIGTVGASGAMAGGPGGQGGLSRYGAGYIMPRVIRNAAGQVVGMDYSGVQGAAEGLGMGVFGGVGGTRFGGAYSYPSLGSD